MLHKSILIQRRAENTDSTEAVEVRCNRRFADALFFYSKCPLAYYKESVQVRTKPEVIYKFYVDHSDIINFKKDLSMLRAITGIINGATPASPVIDTYLTIAQNLAEDEWQIAFVDDIWIKHNQIKSIKRRHNEPVRSLILSVKQAYILERITQTKWPGSVYIKQEATQDQAQVAQDHQQTRPELSEEAIEKLYNEMQEEVGKYWLEVLEWGYYG